MKKTFITMLMAFTAIIFSGCSEKGGEEGDDTQTVPTPEIPADPQSASTSFTHRLLLVQHTGTYCPNCPAMTTVLKDIAADTEYGRLYNHVAAHSYNEAGDAAYSEAAESLSNLFCSGNYPEVTFNLTQERCGPSEAQLKEKISSLSKDKAAAGLAVAAEASDQAIGVSVEVKAAEEGTYRVGVWILEDNIHSVQEGATADWQHTHSNALRQMAGKGNARIYGESLGAMKKGDKKEKTFAIEIEKDWNIKNCKVLAFVTKAGANDSYDIANSVVCKIGDSVSYEYK